MDELIKKWTEITESIRIEHALSNISFNTWIRPLKIADIDDKNVYIQIPKELGQSIGYYNNKFLIPFQVAINEALGNNFDNIVKVEFVTEKEKINNNTNKEEKSKNSLKYEKSNLNEKYTFDTFVVGSNNKLAHASALAVADEPGKIYNPLFIYGGVGLGKTHLMQAIGHHIYEANSEANVLYVTSETFTSDVVYAVRNGNNSPSAIDNLKNKYRNVDVLLIDDIQFIIGKAATQEEFFHTFNQLYEQKKQIVITSDKPPKDMEVLEERFKSRFAWGLTVDIQFPDYETRMAILQKKMEASNYNIDQEILEYIANNVKSNIRELEGALNKIVAYSTLENKDITIDLAREALKDMVSPNTKSKITPKNILDVVCDTYGISEEDIKSKKKSKDLVYPRQIIMYLCRRMTGATYKEISSYIGNRDHSTIIYGEKAIAEMIEKSDNTKKQIDTIINKILSD